jgi:hypothetical protein
MTVEDIFPIIAGKLRDGNIKRKDLKNKKRHFTEF